MDVPSIAHRQAGAFTRRQAAQDGYTRSAVRARVSSGRWRPLLGSVLLARDTECSVLTRAWAAHLATGGVISHQLAGALHGFVGDDGSAHVSSKSNLHVALGGVDEHRVRLAASDVVDRDGLPVTSRTRTVVDLLACQAADEARTFLFRAVQQGWLDAGRLDEQIAGRRFMTGTAQLRELATLLGTGAHSVAEVELHRILAVAGLPFEANVPVSVGGQRFVVDVLVRDSRLVVEVDGRRFHSDADQFTRDRRRQNALVGAGFTVLRFTWLDLVERPDRVRGDILDAIAVSRGRIHGRTGP